MEYTVYNSQRNDIVDSTHELIAWFNSEVVINDLHIASIYVQRKLKSTFGIPTDILIACYPDRLQLGNKYITYPFFIEGLDNVVKQVLANPEEHRNAIVKQTQNSLFST